jgi:secreted trypsin-like serine protease
MKTLIVLLLAIGATLATPTNFDWKKVFKKQAVSDNNDFESRITGGTVAGSTDFPYVVGVLVSLVDGPQWCSGALISTQWVLTAASCVKMKNPTVTILTGAHDITKAVEYIPVVTVKVHEKYSSTWDSNDIALLKMERPVKLSDRVRPVKLPRRSHQNMTFKKYLATITGWGTTERGSGESVPMLHLRYVRNSVISNFSCRNSYPLYISDSNICSSTDNGAACVVS